MLGAVRLHGRAMMPFGSVELLFILAILAMLVLVPLIVVIVVLAVTRRPSGPPPAPQNQRPPDGYWWDGSKWNPPGSAPG
jgi:hypothetical protein